VNKLNKWVSDNPVLAIGILSVVAISLAARTPIFSLIDRAVGAVVTPVSNIFGGMTGAGGSSSSTLQA
jgi:hypothetical protein